MKAAPISLSFCPVDSLPCPGAARQGAPPARCKRSSDRCRASARPPDGRRRTRDRRQRIGVDNGRDLALLRRWSMRCRRARPASAGPARPDPVDVVDHRAQPAHRATASQQRIAGGRPVADPSRCTSTSMRGGLPRLCTRATVSWPAIATLVQMDGAPRTADPADLVRDGALVGVDTKPRPQRRDPVGFVSPHPGRAHAGTGQPPLPGRRSRPRHHKVELDLAGGASAIRRTKPPSHGATANRSGNASNPSASRPLGSPSADPTATAPPDRRLPDDDLGPEHHLLRKSSSGSPRHGSVSRWVTPSSSVWIQ